MPLAREVEGHEALAAVPAALHFVLLPRGDLDRTLLVWQFALGRRGELEHALPERGRDELPVGRLGHDGLQACGVGFSSLDNASGTRADPTGSDKTRLGAVCGESLHHHLRRASLPFGTPTSRASGNLLRMKTIDDETRAQLAAGWEKSGLSQAEYAARNGISERALRAWRARFVPSGTPVEEARRILEHAVDKLQALLAGLEARAQTEMDGAACRTAAEYERADEATITPAKARRPAPEPQSELPPVGPASAEAPPVFGREAAQSVAPTDQRRARRRSFHADFM